MSRVFYYILLDMANNVRKILYGVGINDLPYPIKKCPYYERWRSILCRCYSKKFHNKNKSYEECFICDDWKYSSNFKKWMEGQDWEGRVLDKDILIKNNKIYGPETCIFVSIEINSLIIKTHKNRSYPIGVYKSNTKNKFDAKISINGKGIFLGSYLDKFDAHRSWQYYRFNYVKEIALTQKNLILRDKLLEMSLFIENDYNHGKETKYD
jgi:hypothetical protein